MTRKFSMLILYAATFQFVLHACTSHPLEVTVYYESLCPDCQNFFVNQFEPNFEKFINFVNWILIPYGNAETHWYANGTVKSITCQHKKAECFGNTVQACVLKKTSDVITQIRFCLCFMLNKADGKALKKCAQTYELDYNAMSTCAKSKEGLNFLADYGAIQSKAQPPIEGVPTLALNGKQLTDEEYGEFFANSCKFFCDRLTGQKPECCNSCSSPTLTLTSISKTK